MQGQLKMGGVGPVMVVSEPAQFVTVQALTIVRDDAVQYCGTTTGGGLLGLPVTVYVNVLQPFPTVVVQVLVIIKTRL